MSSEVTHYWPEEIVGTGELVVYLADYAALEAERENLLLSWGLLRSENNALRQQLAEMTEQRDSFQRAGIRAMEQRDKLAELLREAKSAYTTAIHWTDMRATMAKIDAALSELTR